MTLDLNINYSVLYIKIRSLLGLDFCKNRRKMQFDKRTEKFYPYRNNSWSEVDTFRLIFLYPYLYQKCGIYSLYNELKSRLTRSKCGIRARKQLLNKKYMNLVSPVTFSLDYEFPNNISESESKTKSARLLNNIFDDVLNENRTEVEKQQYLERKRKELELENGLLGIRYRI